MLHSQKKNDSNNILLMNTAIGKSKPSSYQLPDQHFIYGKKSGVVENQRQGQMKDLFEWNYHQSSDIPQQYKDFQKFNRMCVQNNVKGKQQIKDYYKNADYTVQKQKANGELNFQLPDDCFVYGHRYKPSTPINNVVNNVYGFIGEQETEQMYQNHLNKQNIRNQEKQRLNHLRVINKLKSASKQNHDDQKSFVLPKFRNISSRVHTHNHRNNRSHL